MDSDAKIWSRQMANRALHRGEIVRRFCENCGDPNAEMHHPDHHFVHRVKWLCKVCHEHLHTLMDRFPSR